MSSMSTMLTGQSSWDCASTGRLQGIQQDLMAVRAQADACLVAVLVLLSAPDIVWWVGNSGPVLEGATLQAPGQGCVLLSRPVQAESHLMHCRIHPIQRVAAVRVQTAYQVHGILRSLSSVLARIILLSVLVVGAPGGL